jgi:hypothetical protein
MIDGCVTNLADVGPALDAASTSDGGSSDGSASDGGSRDAGMMDVGTDAFAPDMGPPDMHLPSPLGGPCNNVSDCLPIIGSASAVECTTSFGGYQFFGGYCTTQCTTFGGNTCPNGSECASAGGGAGICVVTCSSSAQCRQSEGYDCHMPHRTLLGGLACVPPGF